MCQTASSAIAAAKVSTSPFAKASSATRAAAAFVCHSIPLRR
jgi:hypothetical protein